MDQPNEQLKFMNVLPKLSYLKKDMRLIIFLQFLYFKGYYKNFNDINIQIYNIYIKQVASMKGVTATREIFEKAIEILPDDQAKYIKVEIVFSIQN